MSSRDAVIVTVIKRNIYYLFAHTAVRVAAFWQGWDVTLLMLAVVPIMAAMNYVGFRMMEKYSKNTAAFYARANGVALESLSNIRTIAAYTIENELVDRYSSLLEGPMRKGIREVRPLCTENPGNSTADHEALSDMLICCPGSSY